MSIAMLPPRAALCYPLLAAASGCLCHGRALVFARLPHAKATGQEGGGNWRAMLTQAHSSAVTPHRPPPMASSDLPSHTPTLPHLSHAPVDN